MVRHGADVWVYSHLSAWRWTGWAHEIRRARELVDDSRGRDLLRGFTYAYVLIAASIWLVSLALLVYLAHRLSVPIQQLTAGLSQLAAGKLGTRVDTRRGRRDRPRDPGVQRHGRTSSRRAPIGWST